MSDLVQLPDGSITDKVTDAELAKLFGMSISELIGSAFQHKGALWHQTYDGVWCKYPTDIFWIFNRDSDSAEPN